MSRVSTITSTTLSNGTKTKCDPHSEASLRLVTGESVSLFDWMRIFVGHACFCAIGFFGILIFPALALSNRVREIFFAFIYLIMQRLWYDDYGSVRRVLMTGLDDIVSHDATLKARDAVRVLEVGAAYGPNLPYIHRNIEYWRLEPNVSFEPEFQKNLAANRKVQLVRTIRGYGEDMYMVPDGHFDAVVLTYVLCTAKDGRKLLSECKRVLRKGGRLLFAEHVGHPKGTFARSLQDILAPMVMYFTGGCYMNRDSGSLLLEAGFTDVRMENVNLNIPCEYSYHVYGFATV
ncbi:thiol S-methyltransferase TMT1B-like [Dermacentor albipictus]|uniref:thiol S-methyltransferase TMT1B-like n=1 Tax=Dermacentor albipictus TaxID=60249 RepID=UPI0031FC50FC